MEKSQKPIKLSKTKNRPLGKLELIAIALGGMIGGGIFSILGVSVSIVGNATPIAFLIGGGLAFLAAYSYSKLAVYYKDEGATYSFFKKTFPNQMFARAYVGWLIVFGYISTLALYAFTFSSYFSTVFNVSHPLAIKIVALGILSLFVFINLISVNGMGKIEDFIVYIKVAILLVIAGLFLRNGQPHPPLEAILNDFSLGNILVVAAFTFVGFEGFQLVIHAYEEAKDPDDSVPSAIYWSIGGTTFIYVLLSIGALLTIPKDILIKDKEFALAAGTDSILGHLGYTVVIVGALLATSSAINGTLFGASRLIAVISRDGIFPKIFAKRRKEHIPYYALLAMGVFSFLFILTGQLESIIEFGSITFILVSFLMAFANFYIRDKTQTHGAVALTAMILLGVAACLILYFEAITNSMQLIYIFGIYAILAIMAKIQTRLKN
ncbi:MAG: amino acid permease [Halobacteriovoraceae bacterium]|nr:amino acid permease [Halobacteriovoraceae bacterium]